MKKIKKELYVITKKIIIINFMSSSNETDECIPKVLQLYLPSYVLE